jgi:hypothetical protein
MVKTNGHANLQPSQPANLNAARHGLHSNRFLAGEIERHRAELLALPWLTEVDALAVDESPGCWRALSLWTSTWIRGAMPERKRCSRIECD